MRCLGVNEMYGIISAISVFVRCCLLSNPFENYQYSIFPADNMFTPILAPFEPTLLNLLFSSVLVGITYLMVGRWYDGKNSAWGSFLFLVFFCVNNCIVEQLCGIGCNVHQIFYALAGCFIVHFYLSNKVRMMLN